MCNNNNNNNNNNFSNLNLIIIILYNKTILLCVYVCMNVIYKHLLYSNFFKKKKLKKI